MKIQKDFRARLLAREWLAGTWVATGSPVAAEIAGLAGFDWVLLDHEHGPGGEETMLHQLLAVSATPAVPIVRIAANETPRFKRALDAGAHGVMAPFINTAAEARAAVAAMRYPPRGVRGVVKVNRGSNYGADWEDYRLHAHEWLPFIAQIETPEAVAEIDAIAAVDGVDVLFVGPTDLTHNMGIGEQFDHPDFLAAQRRVVDAARKHGKAAGTLVHNPALVAPRREQGFTFVALASDSGVLRAGFQQALATLRGK
jgi:4-hydroxy-2-oxoheptanedioate aldolase